MSRRNPAFDDVFTDEVLKKLSDLLGVCFSHCDTFKEPPYKDEEGFFSPGPKAICVIYSHPTGPWQFAINNDGTFAFPVDVRKEAQRICEMLFGLVKDNEKRLKVKRKVKRAGRRRSTSV